MNGHDVEISFIVVAKNEEFAIKKCLDSLVTLKAEKREIICVDSDSADGTLNTMVAYAERFDFIKVFKIEGGINSAIARNVGIANSSGQVLFFIDGDTEIDHKFVSLAIQLINSGKVDAVTGKLKDIYYSDDYGTVLFEREDHHRLNILEEKRIFFTGGNFVASRKIVSQVGCFDESMIRNQDIDFTSRIAHVGVFIAVPESLGSHHTLRYKERTFQYLLNGYPMFFGRIIRKNLRHPASLYSIMKKAREISFGLLFYLSVTLVTLLKWAGSDNAKLVAVSLLFVFVLDLSVSFVKRQNVFLRFVSHYLYPFLIVVGMFYNFNKNPDYKIKRIPHNDGDVIKSNAI